MKFLRRIVCVLLVACMLGSFAVAYDSDLELPPDILDEDVLPFTDVNKGMWSYSGIEFAYQRGLISGMTETTFGPKIAVSRAMLVTILWRNEQKPGGFGNPFKDVPNGQWYTDAIAWAAAKKVVSGVGEGKFNPNGMITREQMASILYRYTDYRDIKTDERADLTVFPDEGKVSSWARTSLEWAVANNLISGTKIGDVSYLDPKGNATREQVASILMRYIKNVLEAQ